MDFGLARVAHARVSCANEIFLGAIYRTTSSRLRAIYSWSERGHVVASGAARRKTGRDGSRRRVTRNIANIAYGRLSSKIARAIHRYDGVATREGNTM